MPNSLDLTENFLNFQEKASFLFIVTKSVEPIFQSAGPISRHMALEGILIGMWSISLTQYHAS